MVTWRKTNRGVATVAAVAAVAVLAAGCGGDDEGGGGGGSEAQGGTVKLGVLVDLTGELGSFGGPWRRSMDVARDEINEAGGLPGGAKIETVVDDAKTDTRVAVQAGRKMISQDVQAILGPSSGPMVALAPLAKRSQIPLVSEAAGTVELNDLGGDYVFRTVASDDSDGLAIAKFLGDQNAERVGMLVQNEESTLSPAQTFRRDFEGSGGKVVASVTFSPAQSSYRSEIQKVLAADPTWIVCACGQQSGVTILRQADGAGYDGDWIVTADIITPEAIKSVGPDIMEGVYGEVASADESLPAYKRFQKMYKEATGDDVYPFGANAYDAMILVALAMVAADDTSGEAINSKIVDVSGPPGKQVSTFAEGVKALKAGDDVDYEGASGPVNLDETGSASNPYSIQQVTNGKWKQVEFYPAEVFAQG
jgi:branched-chain amino acid transport system substrate-binding protein